MSHDHDHHDEAFFKEQLSTIALCGLIGAVCIMMWYHDLLWFLAKNFQLPVLLGGITLLVLVGIRAVLIWLETGDKSEVRGQESGVSSKESCCGHDHDEHHAHDHHHHHDHDHAHDHHHHDHAHAHDHHHHDHAHAHHAHDHHHHGHDHGHDHGWSPWRYAVLLLPIVLFFLNLPPAPVLTVQAIAAGKQSEKKEEPAKAAIPPVAGVLKSLDTQSYNLVVTTDSGDLSYSLDPRVSVTIDGQKRPLGDLTPGSPVTLTLHNQYSILSVDYILRQLQNRNLENTAVNPDIAVKGQGVENVSFAQLERAALYPDLRQELEGKMGKLRGKYMPGPNDRVASVVQMHMTCCYADARPLEVVVIAPESLDRFKPNEWIEVTGQVQFRKRKNREAWMPVLQVRSPDQIEHTKPGSEFQE